MKKKSQTWPGLRILAQYARGEKSVMKFWSNFIENDSESRAAVELLRKLDCLFELREAARITAGSKRLAAEIFSSYQANRRGSDKNIAHLFYDSQLIPVREGFRPSLVSERRLRFAGEAGTIELSIVPVFPGRFEVTGRLEGENTGGTAEVRLEGRCSLQAQTDEFGFFAFGAVNPGSYQLRFRSDEKETIIRELVLR